MLNSRAIREAETLDKNLEEGGFVLPGELVGTTEEFKPGNGTVYLLGIFILQLPAK